ncbi:MAG: TonB-dependent receptor plug domain-containing protein, partial [Paludibacter sp.]
MKKISIKLIYLWLLLLTISYSGFAQQQLLNGSITDEAGNPIPDVLISIKEQPGIITNSDKSGKFTINGQTGQHIEITSGQKHKTVRIDTNPIVLTISENDALIPLGFGIMRDKEEMTSAIGIVRSDELSKNMVINPANALFGKIPGLAVLQNGGTSWENDPTLFIRGIGTFRDASILTLVDGFERPISSLSLGEIESVEILKDAAALAMYGQRGANGVLLVTTKRADAQRNKVEVAFEHGITQAFRLPKFMDAYGYAQAMNEASSSDGLSQVYSQGALDAYKSGGSSSYPNVNWFDEAFRNFGETDNLKVTFQEKKKNISYFTDLNYQTDKGLLGPVNDNKGYNTQLSYSKLNFRSNLDIDITKSTKFKVNISGNLREMRTPGTSIADIMWAVYATPSAAFPVKTFNNNWGGTSYYNNNAVAQISA